MCAVNQGRKALHLNSCHVLEHGIAYGRCFGLQKEIPLPPARPKMSPPRTLDELVELVGWSALCLRASSVRLPADRRALVITSWSHVLLGHKGNELGNNEEKHFHCAARIPQVFSRPRKLPRESRSLRHAHPSHWG